MRLVHVIFAVSLLAACSDGESSSAVPQGPSTLRGRVDISAGEPGALLVVAHRPDGTFVAHDLSQDGTFELSLKDVESSGRFVVQAVDPADPNLYAAGIVDLDARSASPQARPLSENASELTIDSATTAEAVLHAVRGTLEDGELDRDALEQAAALGEAASENGFDVCHAPSPEVAAALQEIAKETTPVLEVYDDIAGGDDPLLDRLREGQRGITRTITSLNQPSSMNFWTHGLNNPSRLIAGRALLASFGSLSMWGFQTEEVSRDELGSIAHAIQSYAGGNCREKGLMGAYFASRFPEFQQIAAVSVESDLYWGQHAFAIACTTALPGSNLAGWDVWDIETVTNALVAADCYVIDPWADVTVKFTETTAADLGWTKTVLSLRVQSDPSPGAAAEEAEVCAVPASCQPFDATEDVPSSPPFGFAQCPPGPVIDDDGRVYPWIDKDGLGGGLVKITKGNQGGDEGSFDCTYDRPNVSLSGSTTLAVHFQRRGFVEWERTCDAFLTGGELDYDYLGNGRAVKVFVHGSDGDDMNLNLDLVESMREAGRPFADSAALLNQSMYRTCP